MSNCQNPAVRCWFRSSFRTEGKWKRDVNATRRKHPPLVDHKTYTGNFKKNPKSARLPCFAAVPAQTQIVAETNTPGFRSRPTPVTCRCQRPLLRFFSSSRERSASWETSAGNSFPKVEMSGKSADLPRCSQLHWGRAGVRWQIRLPLLLPIAARVRVH